MNALPNIIRAALAHYRAKELLHYDPETGVFTRRKSIANSPYRAGQIAGSEGTRGYRTVVIDGIQYKQHRLAWFFVYGVWPEHQIDHINRDRSDNRIKNLRTVTNKQNCENQRAHKNNATGFKGVVLVKKNMRFRASITNNGKRYNLGRFNSAEQAYAAYCMAAAQVHTYNRSAGGDRG